MKSLLDEMEGRNHIIIYGAKFTATEAIKTISFLYPNMLLGCAVTSMQNNPTEIYGFSVKNIEEYRGMVRPDDVIILVAMRMCFFDDVNKFLLDKGYNHVLNYFAEIRGSILKEFFEKRFCS